MGNNWAEVGHIPCKLGTSETNPHLPKINKVYGSTVELIVKLVTQEHNFCSGLILDWVQCVSLKCHDFF